MLSPVCLGPSNCCGAAGKTHSPTTTSEGQTDDLIQELELSDTQRQPPKKKKKLGRKIGRRMPSPSPGHTCLPLCPEDAGCPKKRDVTSPSPFCFSPLPPGAAWLTMYGVPGVPPGGRRQSVSQPKQNKGGPARRRPESYPDLCSRRAWGCVPMSGQLNTRSWA